MAYKWLMTKIIKKFKIIVISNAPNLLTIKVVKFVQFIHSSHVQVRSAVADPRKPRQKTEQEGNIDTSHQCIWCICVVMLGNEHNIIILIWYTEKKRAYFYRKITNSLLSIFKNTDSQFNYVCFILCIIQQIHEKFQLIPILFQLTIALNLTDAMTETVYKPITVETKSFAGQKPGTSGLRKRVCFFKNFIIKYYKFLGAGISTTQLYRELCSMCNWWWFRWHKAWFNTSCRWWWPFSMYWNRKFNHQNCFCEWSELWFQNIP